jgi:hypothetical protein
MNFLCTSKDLMMSVEELTAEATLSGCALRSSHPVSDDDKLQAWIGFSK